MATFFAKETYINIKSLSSDKKDQEIDFILNLEHKTIKLQIVSCDHNAIPSITNSFKNKQLTSIERDWGKDIIEKIEQKSNHYQSSLISNITLLIHSENIETNPTYLKDITKISCKNSNYQQIFFIRLPDNKQKESYPKNTGTIIKLK